MVGGMRKPIPSLTGLRFIAAFSVLFAHALPKIFPWPEGYALLNFYPMLEAVSGEGMSLFFVLSGFVIHYNYSERLETQGGAGYVNFFIARFARLYPLYLCCLAFDLLYDYSYSQLPISWWVVLPFYLTLTQSWVYLPFGDHALIFQLGVMPTVAWSISTEWFFYFIYPLICFGLMRLHHIGTKLQAGLVISILAITMIVAAGAAADWLNTLAVGVFGSVADMDSDGSFVTWLIYFSPYSRVFEFAIGCLCASIYMQMSKTLPKPKEEKFGLRALWTAIAATAVLHVIFFDPKFSSQIGYFLWLASSFGFALPVAIIIFCCARYKGIVARFLSLPRIVLCGEASYSIYLLHLPVIFAFRWEAAPLTSPRVLIGDALRFGMVSLAIIGLALTTWSLIEVPARRWLRGLMNSISAVGRNCAADAGCHSTSSGLVGNRTSLGGTAQALIAWWSKPLKELRAATFNARAETVETKPFFRDAFKRNRCLIPMSGYYEWRNTAGGKQPWYFTARDDSPLTAAGIWDRWKNGETEEALFSCTMIITEPNAFVAEVHDRMPVLLAQEQFEPWLNGDVGVEYLKPAPDELLQKWPVSQRVNSSKAPADDASLIEKVAA